MSTLARIAEDDARRAMVDRTADLEYRGGTGGLARAAEPEEAYSDWTCARCGGEGRQDAYVRALCTPCATWAPHLKPAKKDKKSWIWA